MPAILNDKAVRSYLNEGSLVMPALMTAAELDELKQDVVKIVRGNYPAENLEPLDPNTSDEDATNSTL